MPLAVSRRTRSPPHRDTPHATRSSGTSRQDGPATTAPGERLVVEVAARSPPEVDHGWTVLATTGCAEACGAGERLHAYQEHHTTVDPGCRWIKHPAAISPVWLATPERMAALARLTVVG